MQQENEKNTTPPVQLPNEEDNAPWYAIKLFTNNQMKVGDYFKEKGLEYFIPMQYRIYQDEQGRPKRKLRPVVSNLIFLKKNLPTSDMQVIIREGQFKMSVITKTRETREYYEIPAKQMFEFRAMCNPDIEMRKFLTSEEARHKAGTPVMVCHGPLKGLSGRLVRENHKYYLLKDVPGISVMLKVTRWCCKVLSS